MNTSDNLPTYEQSVAEAVSNLELSDEHDRGKSPAEDIAERTLRAQQAIAAACLAIAAAIRESEGGREG